ncbi:N-acetyltransferase [Maricaulis sp.]|uniref:GNAT family N-acetyltransferase n=1 Tax=Maricaulis sp. TaxID=1486257 RepID=UPI00262B76C2|nr:N-acetyltransferase [Maricaulis sp.]
MQIRPFDADDTAAVSHVLDAAFGRSVERQIVIALRAADADTLELVAELDGRVIGEIMFSPASGHTAAGEEVFGLALGPVAVLPEFAKRGIGSALIEAGLGFIRQLGVPFCILLADPDFYQRFGFQPASRNQWIWDGDTEGKFTEAFQIRVFQPDALPDMQVTASFHPAFDLDSV